MPRTLNCAMALLMLAFGATGCAGFRASNAPLEGWSPDRGYRPRVGGRASGDMAMVLAFSGGGTRAAALSYGVLQELRDTRIPAGSGSIRLLDEVDLITSVSGGSFTSAYYALHGDGIFQDYEERFLRRDVQGHLVLALLNPINWFRLLGSAFDRSELAVRYYDEVIFDGATFGDLIDRPGPFIEINSTDLGVGNRFTFVQDQFDLICSDLSEFQVARAVTASSAVPVAFSPIVLRNYAGTCGFERPAWLDEALGDRQSSRRRFRDAKIAESYLDAEHRKYVHLVDGGIADNLGLRGPLDAVRQAGGVEERFETIGFERPRRIVVVVVDAEVGGDVAFGRSPRAPSLASIVGTVTGVQIDRYNFETLELMDQTLRGWAQDLSEALGEPVTGHMVEVSFQALEDPEERAYFEQVPTSLSLDDETVDRLVEVGRRLLRESPEFRDLLTQLRDEAR